MSKFKSEDKKATEHSQDYKSNMFTRFALSRPVTLCASTWDGDCSFGLLCRQACVHQLHSASRCALAGGSGARWRRWQRRFSGAHPARLALG